MLLLPASLGSYWPVHSREQDALGQQTLCLPLPCAWQLQLMEKLRVFQASKEEGWCVEVVLES